ncbi:MAG: DUF1841 family protein [Burkholderiales bacterium]|nr:DUF1841 family protein [Burkholderiales bacterium]
MFNPTRDQVRRFFFDAWRKHHERSPLVGLEALAVDVILAHPEYRPVLDDPAQFLGREYTPEDGATNPFLHLSLHLAIEEQLAIDQPPGIRAEFERLLARRGDRHEALHVVVECLGAAVWEGQRGAGVPDAPAYLECLRRR